MNRQLVKKTLTHTLKWFPAVIILMGLLGWALAQRFDDPFQAWAVALIAAVAGAVLEAGLYYLNQLKRFRQQEPAPVDELSHRLGQLAKFRAAGLMSEEDYEQVRQAVTYDLTHREASPAGEDQ